MPEDTAPKRVSRSRKTPPQTNGNGSGADKAPPPPRPPRGAATMERKLEDFFTYFSLPFAAVGDIYCAEVIAAGAPQLAEAWAALAKENANVKRVLDKMMQGGAWGGVVVSTAAVVIPIAGHHGLLPASLQFFASGDGQHPGEGAAGGGDVPPGPVAGSGEHPPEPPPAPPHGPVRAPGTPGPAAMSEPPPVQT